MESSGAVPMAVQQLAPLAGALDDTDAFCLAPTAFQPPRYAPRALCACRRCMRVTALGLTRALPQQ